MNDETTTTPVPAYWCPLCQAMKPESHFVCAMSRKGGSAGTGESKRRGDSEHYRAMRAARTEKWEKARKEKAAAVQA